MPRACIETTGPSYDVARPSQQLVQLARQQMILDWWDRGCSGFELVTSLETIDEVVRGEQALARKHLDRISEVLVLAIADAVADLAELSVQRGIVPGKAVSDAIHIAVASVHLIEYLATWNLKHIANPFLRERIRKQVNDLGYPMPVMCSPEDLLQNDADY